MLTPVNIMVMMRGDGLCCYVIKAAFYPTRRPREGFGLIFPKLGRDNYFPIELKLVPSKIFWLYAYIQDWLVKNNWKENFSSVE